MTDDFETLMEQLGVDKLGSRSGSRRGASRPSASTDAAPPRVDRKEEEAFEAAMASQDKVPDKDRSVAPVPKGIQRVRFPPKRSIPVDDVLDLHGLTQEQAEQRLERFIPSAFANSLSTVLIVTGRGLHSKDGIGVLRGLVETWIRSEGERFIAQYGEAPRAQGGEGAVVVVLRPRSQSTERRR